MRKPTIFRPDVTDEEICQRVLEGRSGGQIAAEFGFTQSVVSQRVRRHTGMAPKDYRVANGWPNSRVPPAVAEEAARLYEDEWLTAADIAERLGIGTNSASDCLRLHGIDPEKRRRAFPPEIELSLCARYRAGENCVALGKEHGVNEKTIRMILERHGIQRRLPGGYER